MTLMFKPGGTYRTRDGHEARVYATDGGKPYPLHGAIKEANGSWVAQIWRENGLRHAYPGFDPRDLLPPAPVDGASWRAGAEAMREKIAAMLGARTDVFPRGTAKLVLGWNLPEAPTPPAAPAPERLSGEYWINVEPAAAFLHPTREMADLHATGDRIACIRIDLSKHWKGEGL